MNLFEIIKNAPETSQLITDSIVITHSKLQQYNKILCSVSGGSDSDILIDLCQKFDDKEYEENKERFHGIGLDEIRKFEKIYRYYPYYTEGCLNT